MSAAPASAGSSNWLSKAIPPGLALMLILMMSGCGTPGSAPLSSPSNTTATVKGQVVGAPCTPVVYLDRTCPGRPLAGFEIVFSRGGLAVTATTNSDGNYASRLTAGTWTVRVQNRMRILSGPTSVTVAEGESITANYVVDTAIRGPQPVNGSPPAN